MPPRLCITLTSVCVRVCDFFKHKQGLSSCFSFRAAQSVQSQRLHTACVLSATSGCVTSAQMCISIRERPLLPSTQRCTHSRGPVPPSVLTCTREAPARCLRLDKARLFYVFKSFYLNFPGQYDRLLVELQSLHLCNLKTCFGFFIFPPVLCLLIMSQ